MSNSIDHEKRIIELETKVSYHEAAIQELSDVITEQYQRIDELKLLVNHWKNQLSQDLEAISLPTGDEKPPHY
mgnify:CR=1 FL=1